MNNKIKLPTMIALALVLTIMMGGITGLAAGPYKPYADTYTSRNNPNATYGGEGAMMLSASNPSGTNCVESTYVWFKFSIPATETTINAAILTVPMVAGVGSGVQDLELRSSAETSWDELTMNWNNQPDLEAGVLMAVPSPGPGTEAVFTGATLAAYLNEHRGENVTLVVKANCAGIVSTSATRAIYSKEFTTGSGVELDLRGPTAVHLNTLSTRTSTMPILTIISLMLILVMVLLKRILWQSIKGERDRKNQPNEGLC